MKRTLKESYPLIPTGEHVLKIKEVDESEYAKFQKLTVVVEDVNGAAARMNFNFIKDDGTPNDVAEGIYTRLCRAALDDQTLDEIDTEDLPGCFFRAEIEHNEGSKGGIFANIRKILGHAEKFDKAAKVTPPAQTKTSPSTAGTAPKKKTAAEILAEARARAAAK